MQEPYLARIRDLTSIPIDVLRRDLGYTIQTEEKQELKTAKLEQEKSIVREKGNQKATKFILAFLLHKKPYVRADFNYRKLIPNVDYIFDIIDAKLPISSIFDRFNVEEDVMLSDIIYFDFSVFSGNEERYFEECLKLKYEEILKAQQERITASFKSCEDITERRKLLEKLAQINKKLIDKNLEEFND